MVSLSILVKSTWMLTIAKDYEIASDSRRLRLLGLFRNT